MPLEQAHLQVVEAPADLLNSNQISLARTFTHDDLAYAVEDQVGNFELVGGSVVELHDVRTAQFLYQSGDELVSVFVAPSSAFPIPDDLRETKVVSNGVEFFDHHCRGCHLVYHRMGTSLIVVASSDHQLDLLDFVPGHSIA
jgi:hypothetical protein